MRSILLFVSGGAAATLGSQSYLTWLADTFISKGVDPDFGYQDAVLYVGFEKAYELSGDEQYLDWYKGQIDGHVVQEDGTIKNWNYSRYVLDEYRMGNNYLYLYNQTGDEKYRSAAGIVRSMLDTYPRTPSGGFWYGIMGMGLLSLFLSANMNIRHQMFFPNQMWLDGIYMVDTFYAKWTHLYDKDNQTAWDDILQQFNLIVKHARNETSGLYVHGWAETDSAPWADDEGRAPNVWDRAVGWFFMSLVEVLQYFPQSHSGYEQLLGYYTSLAEALKNARDPESGNWWQVMNEPYPGREGNFIEASGSAMFTWSLFKGVSLGYLDEADFLETAKASYQSLVENFVSEAENGTLIFNGTVAECGLVDSNVTFEYYISQPIVANGQNGAGPFMLASYEWEAWAKDA